MALAAIDDRRGGQPEGPGLVQNRILFLRAQGLTFEKIAQCGGVSFQWLQKARDGQWRTMRPRMWARMAKGLDVQVESVVRPLVQAKHRLPLAIMLEIERLVRGKTQPEMDDELDTGPGGYHHQLDRADRLTWHPLVRITGWLGKPAAEVLPTQSWWKTSNDFGRLLASDMVEAGLTPRDLARLAAETEAAVEAIEQARSPRRRKAATRAAKSRLAMRRAGYVASKEAGPRHTFSERAIQDAIDGRSIPQDDYIRAWAEAIALARVCKPAVRYLGLDERRRLVAEVAGPLRRLAKQERIKSSPGDVLRLHPLVRTVLNGVVDMKRRNRIVRDSLVNHGRKYAARMLLQPNEIRARKQRKLRRARAVREHWSAATVEERKTYGLTLLRSQPKAIVGYCRVCFGLTRVYPSLLARPFKGAFSRLEYHSECLREWIASPQYCHELERQWLGDRPMGVIHCSYPQRKRLKPAVLQEYWRTTILYLRVKDKVRRGARFRTGEPKSIRDVVRLLNLHSEKDVRDRRDRILELLPDPSRCDAAFASTVRAIITLSEQR